MKSLINIGCSKNPRKIKKVLNLIYSNSKLLESKFETTFPLLVVFCILSVTSRSLIDKLKARPSALVLLLATTSAYKDHNEFYTSLHPILYENSKPRVIRLGTNFSLGLENFEYFTNFLRIIESDESLFNLLKEFNKRYQVNFTDNLEKDMANFMIKYKDEINYLTNILI